jgi:hypothetical protein
MGRSDQTTTAKLTRTVQMRFDDETYEFIRELATYQEISLGAALREIVAYVRTEQHLTAIIDEPAHEQLRAIAFSQWLENARREDEGDVPL